MPYQKYQGPPIVVRFTNLSGTVSFLTFSFSRVKVKIAWLGQACYLFEANWRVRLTTVVNDK